jgi:hypothetical protein
MRSTAPVNDDRKTCDLRTVSDGVTWVCVQERHGGADKHVFRDEADL